MQRLVFLICNLLVIASYPAYASPLSEFAKAHNVEFIVAGCLAMGIAGTVGGMLYNNTNHPTINFFVSG